MYPTLWEQIIALAVPSFMIALAVFAGMYFGILLATKRWSSRKHSDLDTTDPLDIVRERYARGEISRGEYERMRDDLTGKVSGQGDSK